MGQAGGRLAFFNRLSKIAKDPMHNPLRSEGLGSRLGPILIALLTLAAFIPALQNDFVNWDDEATLVENQSYRGLGWEQLRWMFTTFHMGHYQPLSWVTFGMDYLLWGMDPFGYHLTNLLLHAANAVLFYFVALRLLTLGLTGLPAPGQLALRSAAGFAALVFAIHPLRVESVAWATERRDVLSGLFFLLTILCYLWATAVEQSTRTRRRWLASALVVYGLSLLSKVVGITLPIIFLVLDAYPLRRLGGGPGRWFGRAARGVWFEKVPFLILASAAAATAWLAQYQAGAMESLEKYGVLSRMGQALIGIAFYLWKTVIPLGLSPLYEIPPHLRPWDWPFLLSGVIVFGLSIWLFIFRRRWPAGLASWVCYLVIVAPMLGVVQSGPQDMADRYTYLSCLSWAILAGAGLLFCWRHWVNNTIRGQSFFLVLGLATAGLSVLGFLTWKQSQIWHDSERLWRHALAVNQESSTLHAKVGFLLASQSKLDEAIKHYHEAIRIDPQDANAHYYWGRALRSPARWEEAIEHYKKSLSIDPTAEVHNSLGYLLAKRGESEEAIKYFRRALQRNPRFVDAHNNLALELETQGRREEAIEHYRLALQINPASATIHQNLGVLLAKRGELEKAIEHHRLALQINPGSAKAHQNLGITLVKQGQLDEAIGHFQQAITIQPGFVEAFNYLGRILAAQGQLDKAIEHFQRALRIQPDFAEAHESLGQALDQQGKGEEATKHYQKALGILKSRREASTPH